MKTHANRKLVFKSNKVDKTLARPIGGQGTRGRE